jgi:hypothetical protein
MGTKEEKGKKLKANTAWICLLILACKGKVFNIVAGTKNKDACAPHGLDSGSRTRQTRSGTWSSCLTKKACCGCYDCHQAGALAKAGCKKFDELMMAPGRGQQGRSLVAVHC